MTHIERLKQRRMQKGKEAGLENGYTQEEIASVCGVTQNHYSYCESDENNRRLPVDRIQRLAAFYGGSVEEIFPEFRMTRREKETEAAVLKAHGKVKR